MAALGSRVTVRVLGVCRGNEDEDEAEDDDAVSAREESESDLVSRFQRAAVSQSLPGTPRL